MFIAGSIPYQGKNNPQVMSYVCIMNGKLDFPELCSPSLSMHLSQCWNRDPKERPGFPILINNLLEAKGELEDLDHDISQPEEDDKVDETLDLESIEEEEDEPTICHKYQKHRSCAIFTILFLVMCPAGGIYAFRNFIWDFSDASTPSPIGKISRNNLQLYCTVGEIQTYIFIFIISKIELI